MKAFLSILMFCICLMLLMLSAIAEVNLREEKIKHRGQYISWWSERDLNKHLTSQEWTR